MLLFFLRLVDGASHRCSLCRFPSFLPVDAVAFEDVNHLQILKMYGIETIR